MTREKTLEVIKFVEDQKIDVLSELSNPFKAVREKEEVVIDLQLEECKIEDTLFFKFNIEDPTIYKKALEHYEFTKSESSGLSRDALVILNNAIWL